MPRFTDKRKQKQTFTTINFEGINRLYVLLHLNLNEFENGSLFLAFQWH